MAYTKTNWVNGTTPLNDKNMNKIENGLENLDTNISKSTDEYSSTRTYSIGELVIYNNKLYKANQDITTAEAFNSSHWTKVTLLSDINEIKSVVNNNADNLNKMDAVINSKQDKLTAGTGIEITDENTINNINENYSTDEQKIGKWIDGKPLYRKVYQSSEFSNKYNIPIKNMNKLVDINGMIKRSDYNIYCKIPYRTGEASWNTSFGNINITNTIIETNIVYGSGFSTSNFSNIVIIVKYTKTTD